MKRQKKQASDAPIICMHNSCGIIFSSDVVWDSYDNQGNPVGPNCAKCGDAARTFEHEGTVEEILEKSNTDENKKSEIMEAIRFIEAKAAGIP